MRYLFRLSFLIIVMTLTTVTASADKYSRAWKEVDKLIEKDLPESAAEEINLIWDMAAKDNDSRQMLKSAVYLTRVQQSFGENSTTDGIELFKTLLPKLQVREHQALCHAFLAKGYMQYKQYNAYNLQRQSPSDLADPPLEMWTFKMITDTICHHLDQSIKLAGDVGSSYYEEFFPGGNKDGLKLRPLLMDLLMDNAITPMTGRNLVKGKRSFLNDSRLYGSADDFLKAVESLGPDDADLWELYVVKCLTLHNMGSKPSIRSTVDLRRMSLLSDYLTSNGDEILKKNLDVWINGAVALGQGYEKKVKFSSMFYALAAQMIEDQIAGFADDPARQVTLQKTAHDICAHAQKKWPKSEGAFECLRILSQIERRQITISQDRDLVPGERNMAMLTYTNVNTVYFRMVEVTGRYDNRQDETTMLSELGYLTPVAEWSVRVNNPGDWLEHYTIVEIPPVMQGKYYLLASTGQYFNSGDCIAYEYVECNSIGLARMISGSGALSGVTVNIKSGTAIPSCRYTVWQLNNQDEQVRVAAEGFSADDGFISLEGLRNGRYLMELDNSGSKGNCSFSIPWVSDMPVRGIARLYTDRFTYLPGDSVRFTGIAYSSDGYDKGHVLKNLDTEIQIRDINYKVFERISLTTDSMGVVKGSFRIPENIVPGRATLVLRCNDDDWDFQTSSAINVESFRQPKFEIMMDNMTEAAELDRPFTVSGRAVTFTGVPVEGATVLWNAGVEPYLLHPFRIRDDNGRVRIDAGELKTGPDGSFSIPVTVPGDILMNDNCSLNVSVTVTDLNGETHDRNIRVSVGVKKNIDIVSKTVHSGPDTGCEMTVKLFHNNPIRGKVHVSVSRIVPSSKGLPLPFNVPGMNRNLPVPVRTSGNKTVSKAVKELSECVENQNLRERFPKYDFGFGEEPQIAETVFDETVDIDGGEKGTVIMVNGLESGTYLIRATSDGAYDFEDYRTIVKKNDNIYIPGTEYLWCSEANNYDLTAEVGDTVTLRVASCLPGAVIHYFVEDRFGMCGRGSVATEGKQQTLRIPVTSEMTGMFAVELGLAYEGVSRSMSLSYMVENREKQLDMELETFRDMLEPDSKEEWTVRVTDKKGNPVTAAVLMDMYDTALDRYGLHNFLFSPWNPVFVSPDDIMRAENRYFGYYLPWNHSLGKEKEYTGKKAITGILIDPFEYYMPRRLSRGAVNLRGSAMMKSAAVNQMAVSEESEEVFEEAVFMVMDDSYVPESTLGSAEAPAVNDDTGELAPVALRTDMNPTGLFEYLTTDSAGVACLRFTAPQLLTRWKLQGFAFTDSLQTGSLQRTLITRRQIMVEPAAPRFLRQGDRMEFTVKVSNLTDEAVKAKVTLTFTDAVTGKALGIIEGARSKTISVTAGGNVGTGFTINVPAGLTAVTYRITAQTTDHSDGMQETIPVLSNRTQVVQALSLFNNGNEKRTFRFGDLDKTRSSTIADEQLTLEYSASPIWYAIQALPSMIRVDDPSNLRLFHSYMGAAISNDLNSRYPTIRQMLDEWAALPASEWQTQLERNQKLTSTLLEETPWLRSSNSERDRLHSLAKALGTEETARAMQEALDRLRGAQQSDGGWPWIDGCPSSLHITDEILQGLGLLIENGVVDVTPEIREMIRKGLDYMDAYFYKVYNVEHKPESLGYNELSYLMTRSYFTSYPFSGTTRSSYTYFLRLAEIEDTHNLSLYFRAELALLMARQGKDDEAKHIAATLLERSLYDDEMGRYWRDNEGGLLWHEAPIETQALIIRTLLATGNRTEAVEAARWLLKQKQTTGWCSSPATAAAVTALMATGGNVQLESDPDITIYVGKDAVKASDSKATAGYTTHIWEGPIGRDKADVTVESRTPGISWGAVYRSFTEEMDKVEHSENGMTLKRTVWRMVKDADGDRLEEVRAGTKLRVGDLLRIQFDLTTDRNLEYLQLSDMRAATMEPVSTAAGYSYNWRDDIGYYAAPGNTRNVFYIDRLSKGSYRIEYEVNVQKPGRFQEGIAVMQCLYAPAFRATTSSATLTVE